MTDFSRGEAPVVLVTGAARRIGAAIARREHAHGRRVILHYRASESDALALAASLERARPGSAAAQQGALGSRSSAEDLIGAALAQWGRLDALVNNASSYYPTPLGEIDEPAVADLLDSNFKAPLFLIQALARRIERGAVVNIVDMHVQAPMPGFAAYSGAKGALDTLTRAMARELAPRIRVNAVAPGHILWSDHRTLSDGEMRREAARIPMGRLGQPEDIAEAVGFLLSDQARYITGVSLPVDGGLRLN